ncbi:unnamed protein product, partial [Mesorhabditis belari]|uniref:Granulins domain-containing protein n=1 Tax=Mesorhabditis belari TaxID=2138241 RepID=A0AAF3EKU1_9BILA
MKLLTSLLLTVFFAISISWPLFAGMCHPEKKDACPPGFSCHPDVLCWQEPCPTLHHCVKLDWELNSTMSDSDVIEDKTILV